jgi:hypothetical protein
VKVLAEPNRQQKSRQHKHGGLPLTRHPLFPAIVALWFAALIGLGSFALSTALIERIVLAAGIDAAIPAAAPPLGMTARLLLALGLGALGGAIGWALAAHLARAHDAPAPKVFSVRDTDLDDDHDHEHERLPWPSTDAPRERDEPAAPILDPASLTADTAAPTPADETAQEAEPEPVPAPEPTAAQRIASASLHDLSPVELVERLAIALKHRRERVGTADHGLAAPADPRGSEGAFGDPSADAATPDGPVIRFPDFSDRQLARLAPAASAPPPPQATENALRAALAELQRMSGRA